MSGTEILQLAKVSYTLYNAIIKFTKRELDESLFESAKVFRNSAQDEFEELETSSHPEGNINRGITHLTNAYNSYKEFLGKKVKQGWFSKPLPDKRKMLVHREIVLTAAFIALSYQDLGNNGSLDNWRKKAEQHFKEYQAVTDKFAIDTTFFIEPGQGWQSRWSFYKGTYDRIKKECNKVRLTLNEKLELSINGTYFDAPSEKDGIPVEIFAQDMVSLYLDDPSLYA
jgi:hypothetical protein